MYPGRMMNDKLLFGCALGAAFTIAVGCGGRVIIDAGEVPIGQGGAGSVTSTGSGQTGSSSTGSGSTSSGSTSDVNAMCQTVCDAIEKGGCPTPNCADDCIKTYATAGVCADAFAALVFCYGDHLDALTKCGDPIACDPIKQKFNDCQAGTGSCTPQTCVGDNTGGCSCGVACGMSKYTADCSKTPNGQQCTCSIDGMPVGKCAGSGACDIYQGCCGPILFGMGDPPPPQP